MRLFLRAFAKCEDNSTADEISARIKNTLAKYRPIPAMPPKRYYKIPEWFEFTYVLEPATAISFSHVVANVKSGWVHHSDEFDRSSIWIQEGADVFLAPEVKWAELQLLSPRSK
jgi:hypothetical protein